MIRSGQLRRYRIKPNSLLWNDGRVIEKNEKILVGQPSGHVYATYVYRMDGYRELTSYDWLEEFTLVFNE